MTKLPKRKQEREIKEQILKNNKMVNVNSYTSISTLKF